MHLHHLERLVSGQVHDLIQRNTGLHKSGCKRRAKIVKPEAFQARPVACPVERDFHALHRFPFVREDRAALFGPSRRKRGTKSQKGMENPEKVSTETPNHSAASSRFR